MPEPPNSGSTVMPSRPSPPSSAQSSAGNSLLRSISAAIGAMRSRAKRRTMSRSASISSPCPKLNTFSYMAFLLHIPRADEAHGHCKIVLRHFLDRQTFVRAEPDDYAGYHLNNRHRCQRDIVDMEIADRKS